LGERVQVVSGLSPGDAVIVRGMVQPGEPVAIAEEREAEPKDAGAPR